VTVPPALPAPGKPADAAPPAVAGEDAGSSVDVGGPPPAVAAPPAGEPGKQPSEAEVIAAAQTMKVNAFLRAVSIEVAGDTDAATAWERKTADPPNETLEALYLQMPRPHREAFAASGWRTLRPLLTGVDAYLPTIQWYDRVNRSEQGGIWLQEFCDAGPWNEAEELDEEEEDEDDDTPDAQPE